MPETHTLPPRCLADATDLRDLVRKNHLDTALTGKVNTSAVGAANGVAPLDASGLLPFEDVPVGSTATTVARGDRVQALENKNPTDLGISLRRPSAALSIPAATNTQLALATAVTTSTHVTHTSNTIITIATAGVYLLDGTAIVSSSAATTPSLWIGSPDFTTARYCGTGGIAAPASSFPSLDCSATIYLPAGIQIALCCYFSVAGTIGVTYGMTHLAATLLRR